MAFASCQAQGMLQAKMHEQQAWALLTAADAKGGLVPPTPVKTTYRFNLLRYVAVDTNFLGASTIAFCL